MFEKKTVVHIPFGMLFDELSFEFELNNRNSLVHLGEYTAVLFGAQAFAVIFNFSFKVIARTFAIGVEGEGDKRHQIYSVSFLKSGHIGISQ